MSALKVSIKLKSNIILKDIYQRYNGDMSYLSLLPIDLLSKEYRDVRGHIYLSETQKEELDKRLYYAERVVNVQSILEDVDYELLGLNLPNNSSNKDNLTNIENLEISSKEEINILEDNHLEHFSEMADTTIISSPHPVIETILNSYPHDRCF